MHNSYDIAMSAPEATAVAQQIQLRIQNRSYENIPANHAVYTDMEYLAWYVHKLKGMLDNTKSGGRRRAVKQEA